MRPLYSYKVVDLLRLKTELSKKYNATIDIAKIGEGLNTILVVEKEISVVVEVGVLDREDLDILVSKIIYTIRVIFVEEIQKDKDFNRSKYLEDVIWKFHNDLCVKDGGSNQLMMFWNVWYSEE